VGKKLLIAERSQHLEREGREDVLTRGSHGRLRTNPNKREETTKDSSLGQTGGVKS